MELAQAENFHKYEVTFGRSPHTHFVRWKLMTSGKVLGRPVCALSLRMGLCSKQQLQLQWQDLFQDTLENTTSQLDLRTPFTLRTRESTSNACLHSLHVIPDNIRSTLRWGGGRTLNTPCLCSCIPHLRIENIGENTWMWNINLRFCFIKMVYMTYWSCDTY